MDTYSEKVLRLTHFTPEMGVPERFFARRNRPMSYDIWLEYQEGVQVDDSSWNYTSNCAPMWRAAGADLATFHGRTAEDCIPDLEVAIITLQAYPARFRAMEPENGWGSYDTLLALLPALLDMFYQHRAATVVVSR